MSTKLYRFLEIGEMIEAGDEYFSMPSMSDPRVSSWTCRLSDIGRRVSPESGRLQMYRRLVNSPDQLADAKQQITRQAAYIHKLEMECILLKNELKGDEKLKEELIEEQRKQLQSGNSVIDSLTKEVRELKKQLDETTSNLQGTKLALEVSRHEAEKLKGTVSSKDRELADYKEANSVLKQEIEQLYQQQAHPLTVQECKEEYRYLDVGEIIQEGDEFLTISSKEWRPSHNIGKKVQNRSKNKYRRETSSQQQTTKLKLELEKIKGIISSQDLELADYKEANSILTEKIEQFCKQQTQPQQPNTRLNNLFSTDPDSPFHSQQDGSHYKSLPIQPVQYSQANQLDSCQHSVIKYVTRYKDKGGIKDLKKAIHFIQMLAWSEYGEKI